MFHRTFLHDSFFISSLLICNFWQTRELCWSVTGLTNLVSTLMARYQLCQAQSIPATTREDFTYLPRIDVIADSGRQEEWCNTASVDDPK